MAEDLKADVVLEGGGVKGIALVGALSVLMDAGYTFPRIAGTSAGAIVGAPPLEGGATPFGARRIGAAAAALAGLRAARHRPIPRTPRCRLSGHGLWISRERRPAEGRQHARQSA